MTAQTESFVTEHGMYSKETEHVLDPRVRRYISSKCTERFLQCRLQKKMEGTIGRAPYYEYTEPLLNLFKILNVGSLNDHRRFNLNTTP